MFIPGVYLPEHIIYLEINLKVSGLPFENVVGKGPLPWDTGLPQFTSPDFPGKPFIDQPERGFIGEWAMRCLSGSVF